MLPPWSQNFVRNLVPWCQDLQHCGTRSILCHILELVLSKIKGKETLDERDFLKKNDCSNRNDGKSREKTNESSVINPKMEMQGFNRLNLFYFLSLSLCVTQLLGIFILGL